MEHNGKGKRGLAAAAADATNDMHTGEEGADLLLFLAASPSPANPKKQTGGMAAAPARTGGGGGMETPSTPPPRMGGLGKPALPSSMMTTPGGVSALLTTPGLSGFDFSDFVHMTPSPAQKPWKTPAAKTPLVAIARRRLTFDELP